MRIVLVWVQEINFVAKAATYCSKDYQKFDCKDHAWNKMVEQLNKTEKPLIYRPYFTASHT